MESAFMDIDKETYRPSKSLIHYLKNQSNYEDRFVFRCADSPKRYFVNQNGKQIRLWFEKGEIAFIDRNGKIVAKFDKVSKKELDSFIRE